MKIIIKNKQPEVISNYQMNKAIRNMEINCFIEFEEETIKKFTDEYLIATQESFKELKKETAIKEDVFLVSIYETIKSLKPALAEELFNKIMAFGMANYIEQVVYYKKNETKD